MIVVALLGCSWALLTPLFQAPDENAHFAYAQYLAETVALPGDSDRRFSSEEQRRATQATEADALAGNSNARAPWVPGAYDRWRALQARDPALRGDGGGPNPASPYPPAYYALGAVAYGAGSGGDVFTRVLAMRLVSVALLLVTVLGSWLLAGEFFGPGRPELRLATAGTAGLLPMAGFVSGSVTPDALLFASWTLALWLAVRMARVGLTARTGVALGVVVAVALLTKTTSYALVAPALLGLAFGAWRRPSAGSALTRALPVAAVAALMLAPFAAWVLLASADGRASGTALVGTQSGGGPAEFLSYVWQFYLPRLPFLTEYAPDLRPNGLYDVWVTTGWAAFGWLEVRFPDWVYAVLAAVTGAVALLALISLARHRRRVAWPGVAVLLLVLVALALGVHWTEYRLFEDGGQNFAQGRYLLPLAAVAGLVVAQAIALLRSPGLRRGALAVWLGALFVLHVASLGLVAVRFYA